jgi:DNA (cytosine-5)-methyltransferase 1
MGRLMPPTDWTHLDTFSGIGGFALAAAWTGRIQTVQFVEIDPWCRRVLAKHWPEVPQHDDIRTFLADAGCERAQGAITGELATEQVPRSDGTYGTLDIITAGFPCQPFSAAGKRQGESDDRYLWPELARVIRCARPRWCLLENVPGIIGLAGGLDRVLADLGESGDATGTVVVPAAAVGAPHKRDRVWIVAHRDANERRPLHDTSSGRHGDAEEPLRTGRDGAFGSSSSRRSAEDAADSNGWRREGSTKRDQWQERPQEHAPQRHDADGHHAPNGHETLSRLGESPYGLSRRLDGRLAFGPDWEVGAPRVTDKEVDRVNKIKALGNAIVPQVAYELLMMMLEVDDAFSGSEVCCAAD